jgi:ubiquinone/menaquinone biosynthesis C-methylase UbiE
MGGAKACQAYREKRQRHWDRIGESYGRNGLNRLYSDRLRELYRTIVPKGANVLEVGCGRGGLLAAMEPARGTGVDFSVKMLEQARRLHPDLAFVLADAHDLSVVSGTFDIIILSDLLNDLWDVQGFLEQLLRLCTPSTRIVFNFHSHLWEMPLRLAQRIGLAAPTLPQNWLTIGDIRGLLHLAGYETVRESSEILLPFSIPMFSLLSNRFLAKIKPFSFMNLTNLVIACPQSKVLESDKVPKVSVVVPARNEAGNIADLLDRIPAMGAGTEIIFVEGGSSDNTYETIVAEITRRPEVDARVFRQAGAGKGDAVRKGFEHATGDILMILDADMTVAPESLVMFCQALCRQRGEFINGVRLVYPLGEQAMRFFNLIANKFFGAAFSWLLGQPVKDTLCGTKALWAKDYQRIAGQRAYFGNVDPFGDFDLLFGAARLNLRIVDLPVRYGGRTYGTTNISRWSHGLLLLRMVITAARKLKFT